VTVAQVEVATAVVTEGDEVFASFQDAEGGGVLGPTGDAPLRGAGEVIAWLMSQSDIPFDRTGSKAALDALDAWRLDFWWNTHRPAWSVIAEDLSSVLPVGWELGPAGIRIIHWNAWASGADATVEIDVERGDGASSGGVIWSPASLVENEIDVRYWLAGDGEFKLSSSIGPDPGRSTAGVDTSTPYYLHPLALASSTRHGIRPGEPLEAACIQDPGMAYLAAEYRLRTRCARFRTVAYTLPVPYHSVRIGEVAVVNDPDRGLSGTLGIVQEIVRARSGVLVTVRELPEWIRTHAGSPVA
jgi:hypothetical protein